MVEQGGRPPCLATGSQPEPIDERESMQTEEKQAEQEQGPAEDHQHFHVVLWDKGEMQPHSVHTEGLPRFVGNVRETLRLSLKTSRDELANLATEDVPDHARIGAALLRSARLADLVEMPDPGLFDHPLFKRASGLDCLEEALASFVEDELAEFEVTEAIKISAFPCGDGPDECLALAEHLKEQKPRKGGPGGKGFTLPFPEPDQSFGAYVKKVQEGLAGMFADAGMPAEEVRDCTEQ